MKLLLTVVCLAATAWLHSACLAEATKQASEGISELRAKAEKGEAEAQCVLGSKFAIGLGVEANLEEAARWQRKAAEQGHPLAQYFYGGFFQRGNGGVRQDYSEAAKWYRKAAENGIAMAQFNLGGLYRFGLGVEKDYAEAYAWFNLSAASFSPSEVGLSVERNRDSAARNREELESAMSPLQVTHAQARTRELRLKIDANLRNPPLVPSPNNGAASAPRSTGTGFSITEDGYFITNQHVAGEGTSVRVVTVAGTIAAKVVKVDKANDLALLKAEGRFTALPVIASRGVRLGATAATVGFPNTGLQGFAPKLARGEIASLAGAQDDARHFQISAPIQPGNSGGALVDERGNVIGVVVAKLSQRAALATSGALAENVNYAVKSSYLLSFLESVPEVAAKLKDAHTKERKFEDVVKAVEQSTVLVLVY